MRLVKYMALCLFAVTLVVTQANADVENLIIENASFENNYTGWWQGLTAPAQGAHEIDDEDAVDGEKSARITITAVSGTNWHVGITQNLTNLDAGTQYTADFFAKADIKRIISLELKAAPPLPYAWIGGGDVNITTDWVEYSSSFTPSVDYPAGAAAQICFWVGQVEGQVWIDGVRVYEGPKQEREEVIPNISVRAEGKLITTWAVIKSSH
jgi:hypothetical protein